MLIFIFIFLNDAKCGRSASGSRHSVTPQRHKKMLPAAARCLFQDQGQRQSSAEPLVLKPRWWKRLEDLCGSPARSK